jgi:hypothetical protein
VSVKLPKVYSDCYQLTLELYRRTKNFPKQFRPTLARKIEDASLELTSAVRKLLLEKKQQRSQKMSHLGTASHLVEDLKFLTQICCDLELISAGSFGEMSEQISAVGAQLGALTRFYEQQK